jgi:hypothetical protein
MTNEDFNKAGGPAFPVSIPGCGDNGWQGMSLRDWFAGLAMQGMVASPASQYVQWSDQTVAGYAYNLADAMLAARDPLIAEERG